MVRYIVTSLLLLLGVWPAMAQTSDTITNYIYPLQTWHVTTHQGDDVGGGLYHMGVDLGGGLAAGTPVYAVADGVVKEAQVRTQFGLVVLIEHTPLGEDPNVSLYGHLDPDTVLVTPGETVKTGDEVGVLGTTENNGGWPVHLHFGIYKAAYTGEWVYYGHVYDQTDVQYWDDPETYIPAHLIADTWNPSLSWNLTDGVTVGDSTTLAASLGDIGSGIKTSKYKISSDAGTTWTTAEYSDPLDLSAYADGPLVIKFVARDNFKNKTVLQASVTKDNYRYTTPAFVTMEQRHSAGEATTWSYTGSSLTSFQPFGSNWQAGGDIAYTDQLVVTGRGTTTQKSKIKVFSLDGTLQHSFTVFPSGKIHLALADVNGDAAPEIIVGSGTPHISTVRAYTTNGTLLWEIQPFGLDTKVSIDVAADSGQVIASSLVGSANQVAVISPDGSAITTTFQPFRDTYTRGSRIAIGDVTGDGVPEIIVGSNGEQAGNVKFFSTTGVELSGLAFEPFGNSFTGSVSVNAIQWDTTEDAVIEQELLVSQANHGQSWVKLYRLSTTAEVLLNQLAADENFTGGVTIAGVSPEK